MLIYENNIPISSIRFSFMLPAYKEVLTVKDFGKIAKTNQNYANIIASEYHYCQQNEAEYMNYKNKDTN